MRFFPDRRVAVLAMDPTRRRSGGALLGDRIRMNALANEQLFMRSLATRRQNLATSAVLGDTVQLLKAAGFDLVVVETAGIGQSDTEIVDLVDLSMYVMTADYGAASQLEKIDMLDFADFIVLNKFEKRGAEDALRDVRKQVARNRKLFKTPPEALPVYPTIASQFNDAGVNALFGALCAKLHEQWGRLRPWQPEGLAPVGMPARQAIIPGPRVRYLAEIAAGGRGARRAATQAAGAASRAHGLYRALEALGDAALPAPLDRYDEAGLASAEASIRRLREAYNEALDEVGTEGVALLKGWPARREAAAAPEFSYRVREREVRGPNYSESLSHLHLPKIAVPRFEDWGAQLELPAHREPAGRLSLHRRRSTRTGARTRTRPACSRARACPSAPTAASTTSHAATRRRACRPRSTRRRCTARIRTSGPTSTAASATRASRSPRSTT